MKGYSDLGDLEEDKRIKAIGEYVMKHKTVAAFVTDDIPGKAERYIKKLEERFPGIRIIDQNPGPVPKAVTVRVGPPKEQMS